MNADTAKNIGRATTNLLVYAAENLQLTTTPIAITEADGSGYHVTLHACKRNGDDFIVRLTADTNGIHPVVIFSEWDDRDGQMTPWQESSSAALKFLTN